MSIIFICFYVFSLPYDFAFQQYQRCSFQDRPYLYHSQHDSKQGLHIILDFITITYGNAGYT